MSPRALGLALAVAGAACGGGDDDDVAADAAPGDDAAAAGDDAGVDAAVDPLTHLEPGGPFRLSGDEEGQDEDPAILVTHDGVLVCAWYSNRNGLYDKELFLVRSTDGVTWTDPPAQVTRGDGWAFAPSLAEDANGGLHLVWWELTPLPEGCTPGADCEGAANRLLHAWSPDALTWDLDAADEVTTGPGDWLPSVVFDRVRDRLLVYFSAVVRDEAGQVDLGEARARLYRVERPVDSDSWSAPVRLSGVETETTHEQYPSVVQAEDGTFRLAWTRYDASERSDAAAVVEIASTDTMLATSDDGLAWSDVRVAGAAGGVDVLPYLFDDRVLWHTATANVVMPFDGAWPDDAIERPELDGYSARVARTATPDIDWAVWVAGADPTQKLDHAFLVR